MILVSVDRTEKNAVKYDEPQIENLVARKISAPVRSFISGQPSIDRAEQQAALLGLHRDELIAIGIVFALLLIILRAPLAAAALTAVGAGGMFAATGVITLLGQHLTLDAVGVTAASRVKCWPSKVMTPVASPCSASI